MANSIEVKDLYYTYSDGTKALRGINLEIKKNTRVAILGPNGAGKSTLLWHFNALHLPQEGTVRIEGMAVNKSTEKEIRTKVGMVFQDPDDQIFSMTVREDVAFGPLNMGLSAEKVRAKVDKALKAVKIEDLADKAPYNLSYGQKKRVAIAGVLAMEPEIIVLDEPFAFLDPAGKRGLINILNQLSKEGKTVVIATHDVDLAAEWADQVTIIKDGEILANGGTSLLIAHDIVSAAELDFPAITKIFHNLEGWREKYSPKTVSEAVKILEQILRKETIK